MQYDFSSVIDRRGKDALAVDFSEKFNPYKQGGVTLREGFDVIPMWVADMNFATSPYVIEAVQQRLSHPLFGYFTPRDEYYDCIIRWQTEHFGAKELRREHIGHDAGVMSGISHALHILCTQGEKILIHAPTYNGFTHLLDDMGYTAVHSWLVRDEAGVWRMDFEDMERKIRENQIHTAIFCTPQNPCGRVWERWEVEAAMEVFRRNDVYVISDEIWADLTRPGVQHIPPQSISEDARSRTMAFYAPTKTFNMGGFTGSYHIIYNQRLHDRFLHEMLASFCDLNVMTMYAQLGAYSRGSEEWVEQLKKAIADNVDYAYSYITEHFEGVSLMKPQGTYMLFLDCSEWLARHGLTLRQLLDRGYEVGVCWQDGTQFLMQDSIRVNLALPMCRVQEAMHRLDRYVFNAEE